MYKVSESGFSIGMGRVSFPLFCAACLLFTAWDRALAQEITVSPDDQTTFLFSGPQGGPFVPQTLTTWALGNPDIQDASFVVTSSQLWLTVSPSQGGVGGLINNPTDITAQLDVTEAQGLAAGVYTAT